MFIVYEYGNYEEIMTYVLEIGMNDPSYIFSFNEKPARELPSPLQALTANFLCGKALILLSSLGVFRLFS